MGRAQPSPRIVRAAGGIPVRTNADGAVEVLLVHRPKYDDWTFPKGKNERGEDDETCAVREVLEETGYHVTLGDELPSTSYIDRKGRPKEVRYWVLRVDGGEFTPTDEVDELRWVLPEQARFLLSYDRDRDVLKGLLDRG